MENKYAVPPGFRDFTIERNGKNEIIGISDSKKDGISGYQLKRVLAYAALMYKGYTAVIMKATDDGGVEALAVPGLYQIADNPKAVNEKEHIKKAYTMHTAKASFTVYASVELIMGILNLTFVTLSEVGNLLKSLNSLAGKEDLTGLDVEKFVDIDSIQQELSSQEAKQSRKSFFQALLAAKVQDMDMSGRLEVFEKNPSFTLANQLGFRLPHSGPLYTKLGNKPADKVTLESLGDQDVSLLLSTHSMSQKDYKEIRGNVGHYKVYVDSENLGGRKGSKFSSMSVKFRETPKVIHRMLSLISEANMKEGGSSVGDTSEAKPAAKVHNIELD